MRKVYLLFVLLFVACPEKQEQITYIVLKKQSLAIIDVYSYQEYSNKDEFCFVCPENMIAVDSLVFYININDTFRTLTIEDYRIEKLDKYKILIPSIPDSLFENNTMLLWAMLFIKEFNPLSDELNK